MNIPITIKRCNQREHLLGLMFEGYHKECRQSFGYVKEGNVWERLNQLKQLV